MLEDQLIPLFQGIGPLYELRLMMESEKVNKGYAFVTFLNVGDSKKCEDQLNGYAIDAQHKLDILIQKTSNNRLFVRPIPREMKKDEVQEIIQSVVDDIEDVVVFSDPVDKSINRGFAFIDFRDYQTAKAAKRKINDGTLIIQDRVCSCDWATPTNQPSEEVMAKVRCCFVRNLPVSLSEEEIQPIFEQFGVVEKIKKTRDFCFVHYTERDSAIKAIKALNQTEIEGSKIEVTLAKPVDPDIKQQQHSLTPRRSSQRPPLSHSRRLSPPRSRAPYRAPIDDPYDQRNFKTKICEFYANGSCKKGDRCTFIHADGEARSTAHIQSMYPAAIPTGEFKKRLCDFFARGHCSNGPYCQFAHGQQDLNQPILKPRNGSFDRKSSRGGYDYPPPSSRDYQDSYQGKRRGDSYGFDPTKRMRVDRDERFDRGYDRGYDRPERSMDRFRHDRPERGDYYGDRKERMDG